MNMEVGLLSKMYHSASLALVGILVLAELDTVAQSTVLNGPSLLSLLVLCPGLHLQHKATELNRAEYPACAALTSGYVFRIENPATVNFLQRSGKEGHLTTIRVQRSRSLVANGLSQLFALTASLLTLAAFYLSLTLNDSFAVCVFILLLIVRLINHVVLKQRLFRGSQWKGAPEPNQKADLIVLASQDRWFRITGMVDDVKAVTSGRWLADPTFSESCAMSFAILVTYFAAAFAVNNSKMGSILLTGSLIIGASCLALSNKFATVQKMNGFELFVDGVPKAYTRRRALADELIESTGRRDWAVSLGMVPPKADEDVKEAVM